jgi:cytochrome c-type biogenesis protein CcmH/NrfF
MSTRRRLIRGLALLLAGALALLVTLRSPDPALGQMAEFGEVKIRNDSERVLFHSLLCPCGTCTRRALDDCRCGTAHQVREAIHRDLDNGMTVDEIRTRYGEKYGLEYLAIPPNKGGNRLLYIVPIVAMVAGGTFVFLALRRWRRREDEAQPSAGAAAAVDAGGHDDYDDRLDEELRKLDRE